VKLEKNIIKKEVSIRFNMDSKQKELFADLILPETLACKTILSVPPKPLSLIVKVPKGLLPDLDEDLRIDICTKASNYISLVVKTVLEKIFSQVPSARQYMLDAS